MAAPIVSPELQWCDANGKPFAGGSITTYARGTSSPKATWTDPGLTALNTNPVILDAAGRSLMFGDGDYRLVLHDAAGNLIFDIPATTIVSAAMEPVVSAPDLATARTALGVDAAIAAEATARTNADSAEATARANADTTETNARIAQDASLQTNINTETAARVAGDTYLQGLIGALTPGAPPNVQGGVMTTGPSGVATVSFVPAFPTACLGITCTLSDPTSLMPGSYGVIGFSVQSLNSSNAVVFAYIAGGPTGAGVPSCSFYWTAVGH